MSFKDVLSDRSVRRLWIAQLISVFGDFLALFAVFSLVTFQLHGTPTQVAMILVSFLLPDGPHQPDRGCLRGQMEHQVDHDSERRGPRHPDPGAGLRPGPECHLRDLFLHGDGLEFLHSGAIGGGPDDRPRRGTDGGERPDVAGHSGIADHRAFGLGPVRRVVRRRTRAFWWTGSASLSPPRWWRL